MCKDFAFFSCGESCASQCVVRYCRVQAKIAAGFKIPKDRHVLLSVGGASDLKDLFKPVRLLLEMKYTIFATAGTAGFLVDCGVAAEDLTVVSKVCQRSAVGCRSSVAFNADVCSACRVRCRVSTGLAPTTATVAAGETP